MPFTCAASTVSTCVDYVLWMAITRQCRFTGSKKGMTLTGSGGGSRVGTGRGWKVFPILFDFTVSLTLLWNKSVAYQTENTKIHEASLFLRLRPGYVRTISQRKNEQEKASESYSSFFFFFLLLSGNLSLSNTLNWFSETTWKFFLFLVNFRKKDLTVAVYGIGRDPPGPSWYFSVIFDTLGPILPGFVMYRLWPDKRPLKKWFQLPILTQEFQKDPLSRIYFCIWA